MLAEESLATTAVKGVGLNSAMEFAEQRLGALPVRQALAALEAEHGDYSVHRLAGSMVPLETARAAWMAVAALHGGRPRERRVFFQEMGVHIAESNLNGIYKTLLSLLGSPERLAKRVPSLWHTYFRGLSVSVEYDPRIAGRVDFEVVGFDGSPHIGEMAEGWCRYAFELVGGREVVAFEHSLDAGAASPGPIMNFTVHWAT